MKLIRGYKHQQAGGAVLVTINGTPLGLPALRKDERRHSPDGFQFGYAGSAPAELARAILIALFSGDDVVRNPRCYQQFKFDKIATVRGDLLELTEGEVREWYAGWRETPLGRDTIKWVAEEAQLQAEIVALDEAESLCQADGG